MTTKEQAVKGAGERLLRLEDWMRRMFIVMAAATALSAITTTISLFGVYKYWQVTSAMSRSYSDYEKEVMNDPEVKASAAKLKATSDRATAYINSVKP